MIWGPWGTDVTEDVPVRCSHLCMPPWAGRRFILSGCVWICIVFPPKWAQLWHRHAWKVLRWSVSTARSECHDKLWTKIVSLMCFSHFNQAFKLITCHKCHRCLSRKSRKWQTAWCQRELDVTQIHRHSGYFYMVKTPGVFASFSPSPPPPKKNLNSDILICDYRC